MQPHEEASAAFPLPDGAAARRRILHRWGAWATTATAGLLGRPVAGLASLTFQPHFTASAANVLFGYWSHDIGGFYEPIDAELYTRWVQLARSRPSSGRTASGRRTLWPVLAAHTTLRRCATRASPPRTAALYNGAAAAHAGGPPLLARSTTSGPRTTTRTLFLAVSARRRRHRRARHRALLRRRAARAEAVGAAWRVGAPHDGRHRRRPDLGRFARRPRRDPNPRPRGERAVGGRRRIAMAALRRRRWPLARSRAAAAAVRPSVRLDARQRRARGRRGGGDWSGGGELYEDDGWSEDYQRGVSTRRALRWRLEAAALTVEGRCHRLRLPGGGEPGQPPEEISASRVWRLKPTGYRRRRRWRATAAAAARAACRCRRCDARAVARGGRAPTTGTTSRRSRDRRMALRRRRRRAARAQLELPPPAAGCGGGFQRRRAAPSAAAPEVLLDGTYPDARQDYDKLTARRRRLAPSRTAPFNFTKEMQALKATRDAAIRQLDGVARPRARSELNKARVRNATALVQYV